MEPERGAIRARQIVTILVHFLVGSVSSSGVWKGEYGKKTNQGNNIIIVASHYLNNGGQGKPV